MAHSILHFGIGAMTGAICGIPHLFSRLRRQNPIAPAAIRWLALSFIAALFAITPAILMRLGLPEDIGRGWWNNVFFLHPLIDHWKQGGLLWGEFLVSSTFILQYTVLLILLWKVQKRNPL